MKIYLGRHEIVQNSKNDSRKHIPLSYTGAPTANQMNIDISPLYPFNKTYINEIKPYDVINGFDTLIFNEDFSISDNNTILRDIGNDNFYYIPKVNKKERPIIFGYRVLYKSIQEYKQQEKYNIKVGFVDNTKNAQKSKKLISIFGDSNIRGLSANNVIINDGDMSPSSLINREMIDNDILFIETDDGEHYKGTKIKIDYELFKEEKVNLWLIAGKKFNCEYGELIEEKGTSNINTNIFFKNTTYNSKYSLQLYKNNVKEIQGDDSLVITQDLNNNYVVITGEDFFEKLNQNAQAIHEVILFIYLNQYKISKQKKSWVHHFIPDYKVEDYKLVKIDSFYEKIKNIQGYTPIKGIHNKELIHSNIVGNKIKFKYNPSNYEAKNHNDITICNDNLDIIYTSVKDKKYLISKEVKIENYKYKQNLLEITLSPIINSEKGIYITNNYTHKEKIDINKTQEKILYCNIENNNINITEIMNENTIAIINISTFNENKTEVYDIRIKGGGLPENEKNNYNLLDIGSSYGRPARKAGSIIITLPERLKKHEDKIMKYLNDNKIVDRHIILLFEEGR